MTPETTQQKSMFSGKTFHFQMPLIHPIKADGCPHGHQAPEVPCKKESISNRFYRFHQRNPHVYNAIIELSKRMQKAGVKKFGMKGVFEYLRWQYAMQTQGDQYKLNNNYTSLYSRLIMEREAELRGFFETRKRVGE